MAKIAFKIPALYEDHQVLRLRGLLLGLGGVSEAVVSAAGKAAAVVYDEAAISADKISEALRAAGYAPDAEVALPEMPLRSKDGSPWFSVIQRDTETVVKDIEMSGDFRRY